MRQQENSVRVWFLNMKIATRLALGFGVLVAFIVVFGLSALHQMNRLQKLGSDLYHHPFTVTRAVDEAEIAIHKIHRSMKDIALVANVDKIGGLKSQIDTYEEEALRHLQTTGAVVFQQETLVLDMDKDITE